MTILFDLTALYDHLTGIERYAMNISTHIITSHPENHYILVFKNQIHKSFVMIAEQDNVETHIIPACHKFIFYQWRLMRHLRKCNADRYVFLAFVSPWLFRSKKIINTIHDISAWDCPGTRKGYMVLYGKIGILNALRISRKIVTVSMFSKERMIERLGANPKMITVAYNGVSEQFLDQSYITENQILEAEQKYNLPSQYILCLSTLEPRKNMKLLIDAFVDLKKRGQLSCDLVLAGRKGWKLDKVIGSDKDIIDKYVHVTGFIDDEDLPIIYSKAEAFVFPSIYEGFGIPIIEAMSCDTIVVSSDASSLPEVVGDAGILFTSNDVEALESAILKVMEMPREERINYIHKGQERFKMFSWKDEAEKFYSAIEE